VCGIVFILFCFVADLQSIMVSWVPFDAIVLGITISFFILHIEF
jgi:hypothetical protein